MREVGLGVELFVDLLCGLSFDVLYCWPAVSFVIANAFPLFLSSEYDLSCVT